jgi:hypothetical protein
MALLAPPSNIFVKEVDIVKQRPLIAPRELSVRAIDQLQTVLLIVWAELVVVPTQSRQPQTPGMPFCQSDHLLQRPSQGANNIDTIFVDALEQFAKEWLVVEGTLKIVLLCFFGLGDVSWWFEDPWWLSVTFDDSMNGLNPNSDTTIPEGGLVAEIVLSNMDLRDVPLGLKTFQT